MFTALLAIGALLGAIILVSLAQLPSVTTIVGFWVVAVIGCGYIYFVTQHDRRRLTTLSHSCHIVPFFLGVILGFSWAYVQASVRLNWLGSEYTSQKDVSLSGQIVQLKKSENGKTHYLIQLNSINQAAIKGFQPKVSLSTSDQSILAQLTLGDVISAQASLQPLVGQANPATVNKEKNWFLDGLIAKGNILQVFDVAAPSWSILKARERLACRLKTAIPDDERLFVMLAVTLGVKADIAPSMKTVFQRTGTSHLLAISGLHLGLIAALCFYLVSRIACLNPRWLLKYTAPQISAGVTLLISMIYALFSGLALPTQRALMMISVFMLSKLMKVHVFSWQVFMLALLGVLVIDPLCPLRSGFWLSFIAVAALYFTPAYRQKNLLSKICQWVMPQIIVTLALVPLSILFFQQFSLVAPIANLLAIPMIGWAVVPLALLGVFVFLIWHDMGVWLLHLAMALFSMVWEWLEGLSQLNWAAIDFNPNNILIVVLVMLAIWISILPRGLPGKGFVIWLCLPLCFFWPDVNRGTALVSVLDIGQGLASVIETKNHVVLFDLGPKVYNSHQSGRGIIASYLKQRHHHSIDCIVISHHDLDHRGGLDDLLSYKIKNILTSEPGKLAKLSQFNHLPISACQAGQTWEYDGVLFEMLNPQTIVKNRNDNSCVLKVTANNQSFLLTGDIGQWAEKSLVSHSLEKLESDVLLVPHHGSMTSSTRDFIEAVKPKFAIFTAGYGNIYGHPKKEIISRYETFGSENLITYLTGAIQFTLGQSKKLTSPLKWRETHKRFWHYI